MRVDENRFRSDLYHRLNVTTLREAEREHILRTLKDAKWKIGGTAGAAAKLGMKRTTLHSLVKRLGDRSAELMTTSRHLTTSSLIFFVTIPFRANRKI
jgi:transcriptional regulator with GAF, ATPase, and Fis domain